MDRFGSKNSLSENLAIGLDIVEFEISGCLNDRCRTFVGTLKPCACLVKRNRQDDYRSPRVITIIVGQSTET